MNTIKFALIKDGKITIEAEQSAKTLSIGSNLNNDIFINSKVLPKKHILITKLKKNYRLDLPEGMFAFIYLDNKTEKITESTKIPPEAILRVYIDDNNLILIKFKDSNISKKLITKGIGSNIFSIDPISLIIFIMLIVLYSIMIKKFSSFQEHDKIKFNKVPQNFEKIVLEKTSPKKEIKAHIIKEKNIDLTEKRKPRRKKRLRGRKGKGSGGKKISGRTKVRSAGLVGIIGSMKKGKQSAVGNLLSAAKLNKKLSSSLKNMGRLKTGTGLEDTNARIVAGSMSGTDIGDLKTYTGKGSIAYANIDVNAEEMFGGEENVGGSGTLSTELITKSLMQHAGGLQFCYNKELRRNPYLEGKFKIQFTIKANGRVSKSSLKIRGASKISTTMTRCIKRVFSRIVFPSPSGGILTVRYPINFEKDL